MEIIASQPRMKFFDEPLNPRRDNVAYGGLFPDYISLMPETGHSDMIVGYLKALQSGRHRYMNPPPLRRNHRFYTDRIVFKIHEIEHLMVRVLEACNGQLICLLRHPIANSISRTVQPRLELFLTSPYFCGLAGDASLIRELRRLAAVGSMLQRAVISWCFENLAVLRMGNVPGLVVTYEELVLNPVKSCELLMHRLSLPDREAALSAFERPAVNIAMSHAKTIAAMSTSHSRDRRIRLVSKWQESVDDAQRAQVGRILDLFQITAYSPWQALADSRLLHFPDTTSLLLPRDLGPEQPTG